MLLLLSAQAFAQSPPPDPCGSLCDVVDLLLYGTPLVAGVLGAVVAILVHAMVSSSNARRWGGGDIGTWSLWFWPLLGAFAPPILGVILLVALAVTNESFRTLLLLDAQALPSLVIWALGTLILPLVPFAFAHLRAR